MVAPGWPLRFDTPGWGQGQGLPQVQGSESPLRAEVSGGRVATVTLAGELDITNAPVLAERLLKVTGAHPERLVLDLSGLAFMDVAGARMLDCAFHALDGRCPAVFRGFRPSARRIFQVTGFMEGERADPPPA